MNQPPPPKKWKKPALGRGLGALIPTAPPPAAAPAPPANDGPFRFCPVGDIHPNRYQPRRHFAEEELADLSQSIREQGVIQPLVVREIQDGYELVAGERRLRAAKLAGLDVVPVIVKTLTDAQMLEMSIVENIQREDLNPLEESDAYHRLMTEFGLTQEAIADRVGKSRPAVANFVRLRQLPTEIRDTIANGRLSMGHAKALLGADTPTQRDVAWRQIITKDLTVRQAEELVRTLKTAGPPKPLSGPSTESTYYTSVAEDLSRRFGTRVAIQRKGKKGRLEIDFYGDEDLNRVLTLLNG